MMAGRSARYFFMDKAIVLSTMLTLLSVQAAHAVTAEDHVALGKDVLVSHDIVGANTHFLAALQLDSGQPEANLFYSATRILNLIYGSALNDLLDRYGVGATGRDIYAWAADFERDAEGKILLPADAPTSGEVLIYLKAIVLPEIEAALVNLEMLENTSADVSAPIAVINAMMLNNEIETTAEVDYGDVALYRAFLKMAKSIILLLNSYDLDVDVDDLVTKLKNGSMRIGADVMEAYPNLLRLSDPMMLEAKAALIESIDVYQKASAFIRNETDTQLDDLVSIDPESLLAEARTRVALAQIRDALSGGASEPFAVELGQFLDLGYVFDHPVDLRDFLLGEGIQRIFKEQVLYQIDWALAHLADVPETFTQMLSPEDYPVDMAMEIDFGDVVWARSVLLFSRSIIQIFCAYNMDVAIYEILDQMTGGQFQIDRDLIQAHPDILTLHPDHTLARAKTDLIHAIEAYKTASNFIRSETDDQIDDWIRMVTEDDLTEDAEFRAFLTDLMSALNGPTLMNNTRYRSRIEQYTLDLTRFFDSPIENFQNYMPEFTSENRILQNTFPDPTISGVLPDFQQEDWSQLFDLSPIDALLHKLIVALQVCAGLDVLNAGDGVEDVNNDQRVGLQEVIHYLRESGGTTP